MASRWKPGIYLFLTMWAVASGMGAASATRTFSGRSVVDGLGEIPFPPGQWSLEYQRTQLATNLWRPDYFVFRKVGDPIHRLAILRYSTGFPDKPLWQRIDTLHETMGEGVPPQERRGDEGYSIAPMGNSLVNLPSDPKDISWSFISTRQDVSWLCHARLFWRNGLVFAVLYTSPQVVKPDIIDTVVDRGKFVTNRMVWRGNP